MNGGNAKPRLYSTLKGIFIFLNSKQENLILNPVFGSELEFLGDKQDFHLLEVYVSNSIFRGKVFSHSLVWNSSRIWFIHEGFYIHNGGNVK